MASLADKIVRNGEQLEAGNVVLAGSFTRPTAAIAGDQFHVDYETLGSISMRFV